MAFCRVCNKELLPGKSELMKHAKGAKHCKRVQAYGRGGPSDLMQGRTIDLRSDSITVPSKDMRLAIREAQVGDDRRGEDPTVKQLESKVAMLLDKPEGLYLPTGTMANLVAILTHCWARGSRIIVGDKSFVARGGPAGRPASFLFGQVEQVTVSNRADGTLDMTELREALRPGYSSPLWPTTTVVCIENTHSLVGGRALTPMWINELEQLCSDTGAIIHTDGARLINAAVALAIPPSLLVEKSASATFCLNKSLGAPAGSVLVGSEDYIEKARQIRDSLGGAGHQAGMMAAAGLYAMNHLMSRINKDHYNARAIAKGL